MFERFFKTVLFCFSDEVRHILKKYGVIYKRMKILL